MSGPLFEVAYSLRLSRNAFGLIVAMSERPRGFLDPEFCAEKALDTLLAC
jgi:hypothetical protein